MKISITIKYEDKNGVECERFENFAGVTEEGVIDWLRANAADVSNKEYEHELGMENARDIKEEMDNSYKPSELVADDLIEIEK